ncbi:AraC family transcriptional regulator, partial [Acinetobacter baumannii]
MNGLNKPLYRRRISEIYVQLLFEYLEKLGHDPEKVLGEPWPKADSNHLEGVDIDHWESLLIIAKDYLNDPFIGLHVGQTITAQHLGVLGSVFLACENLGAVLERFERYQRLVYDVYPATVRIYTEYVELSWDTKGEQVGPLSDETGRTVIVQFCRSLIRGKERLKEIHFIHERPENVQPYEEYFGCPVLFEQPVALMRFDKEILSLPLKNSDA